MSPATLPVKRAGTRWGVGGVVMLQDRLTPLNCGFPPLWTVDLLDKTSEYCK